MAKFRRGINCITPEIYAELKSKLTRPSDDQKVMREYKLGKTTCQNIRNTENYEEYKKRNTKSRQNICSNDGMKELDDIIKNAKYDRVCKTPKVAVIEIDNGAQQTAPKWLARTVGVFLLLCLCICIGAMTFALVRWLLSL